MPFGDVRVCKGDSQLFTCNTSDACVWTTSGFGAGVLISTRTSGFALGSSSRVTSTDAGVITNPSTITIENLGYADHEATVVCEDATFRNRRESRIVIGMVICRGEKFCALLPICMTVLLAELFTSLAPNIMHIITIYF